MSKDSMWWDDPWNVVAGCTPHSEGCKHCYAASMAGRLEAMSHAHETKTGGGSHMALYRGLTRETREGAAWNGGVAIAPEDVWRKPFGWRKPRRVFVCNMSDLFHDGVGDKHIERVLLTAYRCSQHAFIILTKRAERMASYLARFAAALDLSLPNVLVGVTAENQQRADERRPHLAAVAAAGWRTFVSYEPALGPVDWTGWEFLSWMISGGESGPKARPSHPDWHRAARDFCAKHGIPFFFKQWGEWLPDFEDADRPDDDPEQSRFQTCVWDPEKSDWEKTNGCWDDGEQWVMATDYWQPEQSMTRVGKRAAGWMLDGCEHREFPKSINKETTHVEA